MGSLYVCLPASLTEGPLAVEGVALQEKGGCSNWLYVSRETKFNSSFLITAHSSLLIRLLTASN